MPIIHRKYQKINPPPLVDETAMSQRNLAIAYGVQKRARERAAVPAAQARLPELPQAPASITAAILSKRKAKVEPAPVDENMDVADLVADGDLDPIDATPVSRVEQIRARMKAKQDE